MKNSLKYIFAASVFAVSMTANAQSDTKEVVNLSSGFTSQMYKRPLGLNNFKHLPDNLLKEIGSRVSANGFPTRVEAQHMLRNSSLKTSAKKAKSLVSDRPQRANYNVTDTLFWESFEGWDGQTMPWLPTDKNNWQTKSNIEDLTPYIMDGLCPTWTVFKGDGYYVPYATSGDQMLVCMYGDDVYDTDGVSVVAPAPQQDEWLVSPTVNNIGKANYLSFDVCYSPWNTHFFIENNERVFDPSRIAYDVEVLVTTKTRSASYNQEDYTVVYRLSEEADKQIALVDMDDDEAVAQLLYMNWHHVQISLADYEGQNIRVALRYSGTKGGIVMLDALRVSDLLPVAMYDIPNGSFYYGFGENAELFNVKIGLLPAYAPTTWKNYSNEDAQQFSWAYTTPEGKDMVSDTRDLEMPAMPSSYLLDMPKLTAVSGSRSDEYSGANYKIGGNAFYDNNGQRLNFYVGNFDPSKQFWLGQVSANAANPIYAFGTGGGALYGQLSNYYYNAVDGIGNFFEAPDAPYVFSQVLVPLGQFFNLGATLACTIYKVQDGNTITDEVIAQATVTEGKQIADGWFLEFNFDKPIVVDDAIFVLIDGINNSNLIEFAPLTQVLNHDSGKSYAFVKLNTSDSFAIVDVASLLSNLEGDGNMMVSHCIGLNAVFPYLHSLDGDVFAVADAGAEKTFAIDSYWEPKDWTVECSEGWIKTSVETDEANQTAALRVVADALPNGTEGRKGTIKISALGCEQVITVVQGTAVTGINGVAAGFVDKEGTFTLNGQRVNSANAKNGIFIQKRNGKFEKVLK